MVLYSIRRLHPVQWVATVTFMHLPTAVILRVKLLSQAGDSMFYPHVNKVAPAVEETRVQEKRETLEFLSMSRGLHQQILAQQV